MKFLSLFFVLGLALFGNSKLHVCYTKKIISESTGNVAYVGCKRYHDSCGSNGKLHFGKYPSSSKALSALNRCIDSSPKFVDSGHKNRSTDGQVYNLDPNGDGFLSLRAKPKGREIGKLYNGNKVKILKKKGKYYKVKVVKSGMVGYAHGNWIRKSHTSNSSNTSTSHKQGTVHGLDPNGDGFLSLRSKPKGRQVGKLYNGDSVDILATRGKWYKVKLVNSGQVGWAHGNWVRVGNYIMSHNKESSSVSTSDDWWSIFKLNRKTIAKKYPELPLETINKMAKSDTLKECKDHDEQYKVKQLIKTQLMVEPLEFAKNRYDDYKRKMSKDRMDKLYFYEMVLGLRLSGEEMELISKYNPGGLMDSMSYLDDCAYNNGCYSLATNLHILHLPEEVKKISKEELRIIDQMIIKFLKRGCNNILKKYSDCSNPKKNGCYGSSCNLLASIYGSQNKFFKDSKKNIDKALKISQNMCYDKNNAENCGVLASILIDKGTKYYQKAKHALQKGCTLTNNRKKDNGNICLWCCDNYKDLINKGW